MFAVGVAECDDFFRPFTGGRHGLNIVQCMMGATWHDDGDVEEIAG
jgi:hypothetical protein